MTLKNALWKREINRYIYITAYSPRGYGVNSHAYCAASHQWHRGNLTKRISGLKHPAPFYSYCPPTPLVHNHTHFTYRVLMPDITFNLDFIILASPDNCQWSRCQRDLVANTTLHMVSSEAQFETWWCPSARTRTCLSNNYSTTY